MKHIYLLIVLIISSLMACGISTARATDNEMPIIAYWGVPESYSSAEHFQALSECGFTVSLFPYSSLSALQKACRLAHPYGISILGNCPEMTSSPTTTASQLCSQAGFFGYNIQDEPNVPEIHERQQEIMRLRNIDSTHCFYINLLPYSKPEVVEGSTKVKTYPEYLRAASATSCQQLSFDHYPITTEGIRETWYHNLEMVLQECQKAKKPFWGFVLSVPHDVPYANGNRYPTPSLASLRLQIYSNLAYGAQGIQYFTYWTPSDNSEFHFHDAPMTTDGRKTKTYDLVKAMNQELRSVARLFYHARILSVGHLGVIPEGTTRQTVMPKHLSSLKIVGNQGAIISQFEKDGHRYMAIVNKSHEKKLTVRIKARNKTPRHLTKYLEEQPLKSSYTVSDGDILLFKLY